MRNMSFMLTTEQFLDGSKTCTRRLGWWFLEPGELVRGVKKAMGLKKGEKIEPLGIIRVVSMRKEPLNRITPEDVAREGFPGMTPDEFVAMFTKAMKCDASTIVNRIEFVRIDGKDGGRP